MLACDREVKRFSPDRDFRERVTIPAGALKPCGGRLTVTTDETFVPDERSGNGDRRRLGLRMYEVTLAAGVAGR